jgi:acetyl esterase
MITLDPVTGMPDDIDPPLAQALAGLVASGLIQPDPALVPLAAARRMNEAVLGSYAEPRPDVDRVEQFGVPGHQGRDIQGNGQGNVQVKVIWPTSARPVGGPVLLYCHGGGFTFASMHTHERAMRVMALAAGVPVVGVEYRRTPEHPYPAALEDARAVYDWLRSGGLAGGDPKIAVFGDSAGGTLSFALVRSLLDAGLRAPDAAGLIYPMMNTATDSASHKRYGDGRYGLSSARVSWFWDQYLGKIAHRADPVAVPALAGVSGFPPTALFHAQCDCLVDDSLVLAGKLKQAGIAHTLHRFDQATHGFLAMGNLYSPADAALQLIARQTADLIRSG